MWAWSNSQAIPAPSYRTSSRIADADGCWTIRIESGMVFSCCSHVPSFSHRFLFTRNLDFIIGNSWYMYIYICSLWPPNKRILDVEFLHFTVRMGSNTHATQPIWPSILGSCSLEWPAHISQVNVHPCSHSCFLLNHIIAGKSHVILVTLHIFIIVSLVVVWHSKLYSNIFWIVVELIFCLQLQPQFPAFCFLKMGRVPQWITCRRSILPACWAWSTRCWGSTMAT